MFAFPTIPSSDFLRTNIATQTSTASKLAERLFDTSLQYFTLNTQALYKLMEESTSAAVKSMQLKTVPDIQAFIAEQSQLSIERISGYSLNAQKIITDGWSGIASTSATSPAAQHVQPAATQQDATDQAAAPQTGAHEVDVQPSALVEKMIAKVAPDPDNLH